MVIAQPGTYKTRKPDLYDGQVPFISGLCEKMLLVLVYRLPGNLEFHLERLAFRIRGMNREADG